LVSRSSIVFRARVHCSVVCSIVFSANREDLVRAAYSGRQRSP